MILSDSTVKPGSIFKNIFLLPSEIPKYLLIAILYHNVLTTNIKFSEILYNIVVSVINAACDDYFISTTLISSANINLVNTIDIMH